MKIVIILFVYMASLKCTSTSAQPEHLPNDAPHAGEFSSSFFRQHPPTSSSTPAETSHRSRSRSPPRTYITPPTSLLTSDGHQYGLDQLEFIRIIPYKNPDRQFELRRYKFPENKRIAILPIAKNFRPLPTEEQIVISTVDDNVFAILDSTNILSGIYVSDPRIQAKGRAKLNMRSGRVTPLTVDEIKETPVGPNRFLYNGYRVEHLNRSYGSHHPTEPTLGHQSRPLLSRSMSPPTWLPSADGSVCGLDQLPFIRLIPIRNPELLFQLQRYNFPEDKKILVLAGRNHYVPAQEQIVLSTFDGEIFAILETSKYLAGIYIYVSQLSVRNRVKMNMQSGTITQLTKNEMGQIPVGHLRPILKNFEIQHVNHNPRNLMK